MKRAVFIFITLPLLSNAVSPAQAILPELRLPDESIAGPVRDALTRLHYFSGLPEKDYRRTYGAMHYEIQLAGLIREDSGDKDKADDAAYGIFSFFMSVGQRLLYSEEKQRCDDSILKPN